MAKAESKPTNRRAIKRWNRRGQDYYDSVLGPPWHALGAAEKDFRDAQMAVAKIDARDMGELALKACLSMHYDSVRLYYPDNTAVIGFSVAINLVKLTAPVTS